MLRGFFEARRALVWAAALCMFGCMGLPAQSVIAWRVDFDKARRDAAKSGKLLFVVVHQAAEEGNEGMIPAVYQHPRLATALEGSIAALCCHAPMRHERAAAAAFGVRADQLERGEKQARQFLFGMEMVITPQHLILHPDGDVLWHNVRVCGLQHVLQGIETAKRRADKTAEARQKLAVRDAVEMAKRIDDDFDEYTRLMTLVRHSPPEQLWTILDRLSDRETLCERLLRDAMKNTRPESSRRRLELGRSSKQSAVVQQLIRELDDVAEAGLDVADVPDPLPVLGVVGLDDACFDGEDPPRFADSAAGVTVVWVFQSTDKTTSKQIAALRPVVKELQARGVQFIGLGGTLRPESDLPRVREMGFPFQTGTFYYNIDAPLGGMSWFPGALIVDQQGQIVYRTEEQKNALLHSYVDFAAWVRGILRNRAKGGGDK